MTTDAGHRHLKEGKEREKERFRDRERQKENKTNNPENYAAHHVFSSKFCRITLNVTDVKREGGSHSERQENYSGEVC